MRRQIFSRILGEVGWDKKETDGHTESLLRNMLVGTLSNCDDTEVIDKCQELFKQHTRYVGSGSSCSGPLNGMIVLGLIMFSLSVVEPRFRQTFEGLFTEQCVRVVIRRYMIVCWNCLTKLIFMKNEIEFKEFLVPGKTF